MVTDAQIILASASPRRRELLDQIGIRALVHAVDIDESPKTNEAVLDYVQRLAVEKARAGFQLFAQDQTLPVLGSDTVVELAGTILGKPENSMHAKQILRQLSEKKHTVHTSVAIVTIEQEFIETSSTQVQFKKLEEQEINDYVATGEPNDKAGAYAIQGLAAQFIENIDGSFSGVMGLPLYETAQLLKRCGIQSLG